MHKKHKEKKYFLQSSSTSLRMCLGLRCLPINTFFMGIITSYRSIVRYLKKKIKKQTTIISNDGLNVRYIIYRIC